MHLGVALSSLPPGRRAARAGLRGPGVYGPGCVVNVAVRRPEQSLSSSAAAAMKRRSGRPDQPPKSMASKISYRSWPMRTMVASPFLEALNLPGSAWLWS